METFKKETETDTNTENTIYYDFTRFGGYIKEPYSKQHYLEST